MSCEVCDKNNANPDSVISKLEREHGLSDYSHGHGLARDWILPHQIVVSTVRFPHHGISSCGYERDAFETWIFDKREESTLSRQRWHRDAEQAVKFHKRIVRILDRQLNKK